MAPQESTAAAFSAPGTGRVLPVVPYLRMDAHTRPAKRGQQSSGMPGLWFDVTVTILFVVALIGALTA